MPCFSAAYERYTFATLCCPRCNFAIGRRRKRTLSYLRYRSYMGYISYTSYLYFVRCA